MEGKKANKWIQFLQNQALKNNTNFSTEFQNEENKKLYKELKNKDRYKANKK